MQTTRLSVSYIDYARFCDTVSMVLYRIHSGDLPRIMAEDGNWVGHSVHLHDLHNLIIRVNHPSWPWSRVASALSRPQLVLL